MYRKAVVMQLSGASGRMIALSCFAVVVLGGVGGITGLAEAALERTSVTFGGPGATTPGRELSIEMTAINTATSSSVTPDEIARFELESSSVRFNGDSDSVSVCSARLPTDGEPAVCPRSALVGSGNVTGIIGEPGERADMYGALSIFKGSFKLFNYKHPHGHPARMIAVVRSSKPFRDVAINLVVPVSAKGVVRVDIPRFSKLPRLIRKSYPKRTKLVVTKLKAAVVAPRKRRGRAFLSLRAVGQMEARIQATGR